MTKITIQDVLETIARGANAKGTLTHIVDLRTAEIAKRLLRVAGWSTDDVCLYLSAKQAADELEPLYNPLVHIALHHADRGGVEAAELLIALAAFERFYIRGVCNVAAALGDQSPPDPTEAFAMLDQLADRMRKVVAEQKKPA